MALERLATLPAGMARRTLALRARLKAARMSHQTEQALETARLLGKHRAFSPVAAESIVRGLAMELINSVHDPAQLQRIWLGLESAERAMPEIAVHAAQRLAQLGGDAAQVRAWLLPVWERMAELPDTQQLKVVLALQASLQGLDANWLARIESAQKADPRNPRLLYLSAIACLRRELWGKAQQLFTQSVQQLNDAPLRASAWRHLAQLAEQRGDAEAAAHAWKQAAQA
jgi:HemY protein